MTKHIYVANHTPQDVYVTAVKSLKWKNLDKKEVEVKIQQAIDISKGDVYKLLEFVRLIPKARVLFPGHLGDKKINQTVTAFKQVSVKISPNTYQDALATGFSDSLSISGIAGQLGAETITLFVMTDDGKNIVDFITNIDHSWIVTPSKVVRAKYGTINGEDPASGQHNWAESPSMD
ncbi:hypothetical protein [Crocosphaera sp.]|uniref:hypothetical protein n=1 Tax=Crocosphaera sp. TaxID=2729996 RepID=UPI00257F3121|nr:hypothetical protein [Crocosphaera sp.]NQZ60855.1 hypothetical protein [Crocosphaera sp.]